MVNVPNDLRKNKETVFGNMDLRETICVFTAGILAIGILYYFRVFLAIKSLAIIAFFAGLTTIPFLVYGFKRVNGMRIDDYLKIHFNNKIMASEIRLNRYDAIEKQVKKRKYELVRIYKLENKQDIFKLRDYLFGKNILILTEYIEYKNEYYAILRLDGTKLIKDKINKENKIWLDATKLIIRTKISNLGIRIKKFLRFKNVKDIDLKNNKFIHKKNFIEYKNEVNIFESFENIDNIRFERIDENIAYIVKKKEKKIKKNEKETINEDINIIDSSKKSIFELIRKDERTLYELHLFNKENLYDFIKENINDKFIFINNDNRVNMLFYGDDNLKSEALKNLIDLKIVDKKTFMYENLVSNKCINSYNLYRNIENIENIL